MNFILALIVLVDMRQGSLIRFFEDYDEELWYADALWYAECLLGIIFGCNCLVHIASYVWVHFWEQPVPVTPKQTKLLRISDTGETMFLPNEARAE
ncbi:hypothetical protein V5799_015270 [Amblyomma americanum]|uniref:Uncharacterized protein n=1 Tax=Amblyomma americanum TaxID=6943 RepID=A0AAQ4E0M6_AMBAM